MTTPAKLVWITPDAERVMIYCARVSSPHQDSDEFERLLGFCIRNKHWSVFQMANMCIEVSTSRAISAQILRHTFDVQEFSQRYAAASDYIVYPARRQDDKNRQNSIDDMSDDDKQWFIEAQVQNANHAFGLYDEALRRGVAKEQARFLLPMQTQTKLYLNGTIRQWIHYLDLRTSNGTQAEHKEIADACREIFVEQLPVTAAALGWIE